MFPNDIIQYPQWICWKYAPKQDGGYTKLPYSPRTGQLASVANPSDWTDYATAVSAAMNGNNYSGIGFVLTKNDPFCFVDLDDPQGDAVTIERFNKIVTALDSYSEMSPSGKGLHIIVRGSVPSGRRRNKVEVYSDLRYMTMTGLTYQDRPILDRHKQVLELWGELIDNPKPIPTNVGDLPEKYNDEAIYNTAKDADNGEKFLALWSGDWQRYYPSQSEADFALINILGFYSRNVVQIKRMFKMSALAKRDKAQRTNYIEGMIRRSFDNLVPEIPFEAIKASVEHQLAHRLQKPKPEPAITVNLKNPFAGPLFENVVDGAFDWTRPPGLLGDIAEYVYAAAPRPVKEIALGAAIGLMAGICGRSYNVSGTGLNQYVLVLAKTGVGKEAASAGIDKLMQHLKMSVPAASDFIGPAEIASGQALIKYLAKHPCFVSIVGEFGLMLAQMCSVTASQPQVTLRRMLLTLFNKSGQNDALRPIIYSDKDKNTEIVKSPAFTILGESTPEIFYQSLDEAMIAQGLLPRFTIIEYRGGRPDLNDNHKTAQPSADLMTQLSSLAANCLILGSHNKTVDVTLDPEALAFANAFNKKCDIKINNSEFEISRQLWNRAHIKALKLSALIAIGLNPFQPVVNLESIKWAVMLVERDVLNILHQFEMGKAGKDTSEINQINELVEVIGDYLKRPVSALKQYQVMEAMHADRVFPSAYLQRRLFQKNAFRGDRLGASTALKRALESLTAEGCIRELRQIDVFSRYSKTMKCFIVLDPYRFITGPNQDMA